MDFKNAQRIKNIKKKRVFDNQKNVILVVCVGKPTYFKSPPMATQMTSRIETQAEAPTKEVKVEAADLSQLTIQGRKVVAVRVVGVALFIKFEEVEGETDMALGAAAGASAEARVTGSG
jgi:hypothetical protein